MAIPILDSLIQQLADTTKLPADLLKIALCLTLSYPFCAVLKRIPDGWNKSKQVYCVAVSMFYLVGIFSLVGGLVTLLISSLFTYYFAKYYKHSLLMPWINFLFVMGHLFINHVSAQIKPDFNANTMDITSTQMVLVMKITSFAWSVSDGQQFLKWKKSQEAVADGDAVAKSVSDPLQETGPLSPHQREACILKYPTLLDWLAYVFFFPSLLTGPSYEYAEFSRWLDLSMFDETVNDPKRGRAKFRKIPRSGFPSLKKLVEGIFWIVFWINLTSWVTKDYMLTDDFYLHHNFLYRIFYLYVLGFSYRLKFYGAWSISEGACILSGLGYNGKTPQGKYKWNRVQNIDPWGFETGQNTKALLEAWNQNTNKWLKNYVYLRVTPKGKKPGFVSTLSAFTVSAIWHGTRPGYYLTFITGAFYQTLGKIFRRNFRPLFLDAAGSPLPSKRYYDIVCYVLTQVCFGYLVQPFVLLDIKPSFKAWGSVYFYCHIGTALVLFVFAGPFKKQVVGYLKSKQPKPLKKSDIIRAEARRLKDLREELVQLYSPLGIPGPDPDHLDEDIKDALQELEEMRSGILTEIQSHVQTPGSKQ